jgi:hypothetical protein
MHPRFVIALLCIMACGCVDREALERQRQEQEAAHQRELREAALSQQRQQISLDIQRVQDSRSLVLQELTNRQQVASSFEVQANDVNGQLTTLRSDANAYIVNHKMAALCLASGGVALSDDNEFADDVQSLGTVAALICLAAFASNANFRSEVINLGDYLVQASTRAKDLEARLQSAQSSLATAQAEAAAQRSRFDSLDVTIQNLQLQLNAVR